MQLCARQAGLEGHACWKMLMADSDLSGSGRRPATTVVISPDHHSPSMIMAACAWALSR